MRKLNYMDSVHRDGTIWNLTCMVLLMAFPVSLCFIFAIGNFCRKTNCAFDTCKIIGFEFIVCFYRKNR